MARWHLATICGMALNFLALFEHAGGEADRNTTPTHQCGQVAREGHVLDRVLVANPPEVFVEDSVPASRPRRVTRVVSNDKHNRLGCLG